MVHSYAVTHLNEAFRVFIRFDGVAHAYRISHVFLQSILCLWPFSDKSTEFCVYEFVSFNSGQP